MDRKVMESPPTIAVSADNWFHLGWIECLLGMDRREFASPDILVRNADCEAYEDGYDMARSTEDVHRIRRTCRGMARLGQLRIGEIGGVKE